MDWLNIHTSVLDSAEFLTAEPVDRGTWLCLQRFCCGQENGGRILGANFWTDRIWQQLAGVTLKEVRHTCQLWRWEGDDLLVNFYNLESEQKVQANRKVGIRGGHASALKRKHLKETLATGTTELQPHGSTESEPHGSTDEQPSGGTKRNVTERNVNTPVVPKGTEAGGRNLTKPKRTRTQQAGSVLLSDLDPDLAQRCQLVGGLMRRQERTPWSPRELEAFRAARLDAATEDDFHEQLEPMRAYYHAKIAVEKDYRRRDLQTLLNNWTGELDRARAWARDHNDGIQKL